MNMLSPITPPPPHTGGAERLALGVTQEAFIASPGRSRMSSEADELHRMDVSWVATAISVAARYAMRTLARNGGTAMYPTPATARAVELVSDLRMTLPVVLGRDGIDPEEREILSALDDLLDATQHADDGRKAAISLMNIGDLTAWHERMMRERERDRLALAGTA